MPAEPPVRRIPLMRPFVDDLVRRRVLDVLDSGQLTEGAVTLELEAAFARYVGCAQAIAVTSCTTGLELALRALGVGPGDEVIVPDFTYPATAMAVNIVGATPVLVDVSPDSLLIDCDAVEAAITPRTKAVIPVSLFGNPLDYGPLDALRARHGLRIVEDTACSIGAAVGDVRVGSQADISVFSLHPRKFITSGEGGIITTDDAALAAWMRSYKRFGMAADVSDPTRMFERVGTNYKLSNVLAAIGLSQMERIDQLLARRFDLARNYIELLSGRPGIRLPTVLPGARHSYQSFCVLVERRDAVKARLLAEGIEVQLGTYALHVQPAFADRTTCRFHGALPGSARAFATTLALPLFHDLSPDDQLHVANRLLAAVAAESVG